MLRMLLVEAAQIAVRFDPGLRKAAPKNTDRIILSLTPPSLLSRGSLSSGGVSEIKNARLQAVCLPPFAKNAKDGVPSVGRCRRDQGAWQVTSLTPTFGSGYLSFPQAEYLHVTAEVFQDGQDGYDDFQSDVGFSPSALRRSALSIWAAIVRLSGNRLQISAMLQTWSDRPVSIAGVTLKV